MNKDFKRNGKFAKCTGVKLSKHSNSWSVLFRCYPIDKISDNRGIICSNIYYIEQSLLGAGTTQ